MASVPSSQSDGTSVSNLMKDELNCPVCLDTLTDPHTLTCLHTCCNMCIERLPDIQPPSVRDRLLGLFGMKTICCPECRESSKVDKIRKDFYKQKLLDYYNSGKFGKFNTLDTKQTQTDQPACFNNQETQTWTTYIDNQTQTESFKITLKATALTELDFKPIKVLPINDQLWCLSIDGDLHVYNQECEFVKIIKYKNIETGWSFTVSHTGYIILACSEGKGLYECDSKSKSSKQIVKGEFSDVASYDKYLYALEYEQCELFVLQRGNGKWLNFKHYKLWHNNSDHRDRICVNKKGFYISSYRDHCIYSYNKEGEFPLKIGTEGRGPGEFNGPLLCHVGEYGNMIVADYYNHRLQMYDRTSHWHVMNLPVENNPGHAVVGDEREMWVIQYNPTALVKFT